MPLRLANSTNTPPALLRCRSGIGDRSTIPDRREHSHEARRSRLGARWVPIDAEHCPARAVTARTSTRRSTSLRTPEPIGDGSSPGTQYLGETLEVSERNRSLEGGVHHDGWFWKWNGFARMACYGRAVARPGRTDRVARRATTRQELTADWPSCSSSGRTTTWMSTFAVRTAPEASPSSVATRAC